MKPFDQALYDVDDKAKFIVINWLNALGFQAEVNPDQYGIDVLATKQNKKYAFEVEVKHNWSGKQFPYGTVHFSARKQKFLHGTEETFFIMLNNELTHAIIVTGQNLSVSPTISKDTKYTSKESFISIQISKCSIAELG